MSVIILSGLPGSGKSTWAKEWLAEDPSHRIRINYDDLRLQLYGTGWKWNRAEEEEMKKEALKLAEYALTTGASVVIDNTNLADSARRTWRNLAKRFGIEAVEMDFDTPVAECVRRDSLREGTARVGRAVIERMALFYGYIDWSDRDLYPRDFIIVDMDGTVADCNWRRKLALEGPTRHKEGCHNSDLHDRECPTCGGKAKKNWPLFAANVEKDPPIQPIIDLVSRLSYDRHGEEIDGYHVIIVSGREIGPSGKGTEQWINDRLPFPVRHLFMRASQDYRADDIIKQEILDLLPKERIKYVFDDRRRVVDMWRRNGLICLQVADGEF